MKRKCMILLLLFAGFVLSGFADEASAKMTELLSRLRATIGDHTYAITRKSYDRKDGHLVSAEKVIINPKIRSFRYFSSMPGEGTEKELRIVYGFRFENGKREQFDPRRHEWLAGTFSTFGDFSLASQPSHRIG